MSKRNFNMTIKDMTEYPNISRVGIVNVAMKEE